MQKADLIVALGARFDDRVTGKLASFAPDATIMHADIDPAEIGKNRHADVPIVGRRQGGHRRADRRGRGRSRPRGARRRPHGVVGPAGRPARDLPARLRLARRRLALPAVRHRADRRDRRPGRASTRPASGSTRCGRRSSSATRSRAPGSTPAASARWATRCRPRWAPRSAVPDAVGLGDRRRRLLPDDQPGAGHLRDRGHPDQGGGHQQRQPRHGPAVADPVLRRALLPDRPRHPQAPHPGLHDAGRGDGLRRAALRVARRTSTASSRRPWRSTTGRW